MSARSKYAPLAERLRSMSGDRIRLSFREIEEVLGFQLPRSARAYAPWWANVGGSHVQAEAWMGEGWRTSDVDVGGERVTFQRDRRREDRPGEQSSDDRFGVADVGAPFVDDDAIVINRSALRGGAVRMLEDYREAEGGSLGEAAAYLLNGMALERRRQLIEWFTSNAPKVPGDSTDLIREDRDAR